MCVLPEDTVTVGTVEIGSEKDISDYSNFIIHLPSNAAAYNM